MPQWRVQCQPGELPDVDWSAQVHCGAVRGSGKDGLGEEDDNEQALRLRRAALRIIAMESLWAVAACSRATRPMSTAEPPAPVALTPDSAEYEVYSAILRVRFGDLIVSDSTLPSGQVYCLENGDPANECVRRSSSDQSPEMWTDYAGKNTQRAFIQGRFDRDIRVTLSRDLKEFPRSMCEGPTVIEFSRVGFDRAKRLALVTVKTTQGPGPHPGCGLSSSTTVLYERAGTRWKIRRIIGGLIT